MLNKLLETAEEIVVLGKGKGDKVRISVPFQGDVAKHYFDESLSNPDEENVEGFQGHYRYDSDKGLITGLSTFLTLRLDTKLRQDGLWLPTISEAKTLNKKGKLINKIHRSFGIVVYSDLDPNQQEAKEIMNQTRRIPPLIIPFTALDYRLDKKFFGGIAVFLGENKDEIISGKKAKQYLDKKFKENIGNSGVCEISRCWNGDWVAEGWNGFDKSTYINQVDFVCGEVMREHLKSAYGSMLNRKYDVEKEKLDKRIESLQTERFRSYHVFAMLRNRDFLKSIGHEIEYE